MIFVDTGAWFAEVVADDIDHMAASEWFKNNTEQLFVTDYVIDETLTLLRTRGEYRKALELGKLFFDTDDIYIHFLSEENIRQTWELFREYSDKDWSFTDCTSKFICEAFGISHAVSFDRHFRQFGSLSILP